MLRKKGFGASSQERTALTSVPVRAVFAAGLLCLFSSVLAWAQKPLELHRYYTCNGQRIVVVSGVDASDKDYNDCIVQFPDRPQTADGRIPGTFMLRRNLVKLIQTCTVGGAAPAEIPGRGINSARTQSGLSLSDSMIRLLGGTISIVFWLGILLLVGRPAGMANQNANAAPNMAVPVTNAAATAASPAVMPEPAPTRATPETAQNTIASPQLPMPNSPAQNEDALRQQLHQSDIYDLSGEKAAAEVMKRDDAFKGQQLAEKAQQTKDFFAGQDRKQQQTYQEIQADAGQQLKQQQEKEFWEQKTSQEMQAGMEKELQGLHEAAKQAHQEWRAGFTEGICREDAAAQFNKDIADRVGAYKARLDDMGTNPVDAESKTAQYQVKLDSEAAPQIDQKATELQREHFPEYSAAEGLGNRIEGQGPNGSSLDQPSQHGPEHPSEPPESHVEAEAEKVGKSGPGISNPAGGPRADMPGLGGREAIRSSQGYGSGGESADQTDVNPPGQEQKPAPNSSADDADASAYAALSTRAKLEAQTEKATEKANEDAWETSVHATTNYVAAGAEVADHLAGEAVHAESLGAAPGLPHDVIEQGAGWAKIMKEQGPAYLEAQAYVHGEKAKELGKEVSDFVDKAKVAAGEQVDRMVQKTQDAMDTASGEFEGGRGRGG
jgi:hypothetical protein